ncbi:ComF family protein [Candidatus Jorgensenbacteria bacterium]|nr:ComF family protein [Candidatus Jorgensenbacteria bacterium]
MKLQNLLKTALDIIFPPQCVSCIKKLEAAETILCKSCLGSIILNSSLYCPICNRRLYLAKTVCHTEAKCILGAASSYEIKAVRDLVHALKYNHVKVTALLIAEIIKKYLMPLIANSTNQSIGQIKYFTVLPIPLHPQRERERGFNQAVLIAESLKNTIAPIIHVTTSKALIRNKNVPSQISFSSYKERKENVSNVFEVTTYEEIIGKNILLIDDVATSNATINEAARVLKEAGAKKIIALVFAKA